MQLTAAHNIMIVGLGKTGLSCARYLRRQGLSFAAADTRETPPGIDQFCAEFPGVELHLGSLDAAALQQYDVLVMSPGVDLRMPAIQQAVAGGARITGDIDLFASAVQAPIVAITGSNAKSTVTTLVGDMAARAGLKVCVAGNIGTPVLDLLADDEAELYVLELSSFQLETTSGLGAEVASVLNVSEDHMDRYDSFADYVAAKHRIFDGCRQIVVNREDQNSLPRGKSLTRCFSFGLDRTDEADTFSVLDQAGQEYLAFNGVALMPVSELKISGRHNMANALAALALGHAAGLDMVPMLTALRQFAGLKHRCQWVAEQQGVTWVNDSKGTNVGATVAAVSGLGSNNNVILLAGGVGKGADFSELAPVMQRFGKLAILFGEDAGKIAAALQQVVAIERTASLQDAVSLARQKAHSGDIVLLSPACASFDMFSNYEQRGDVFIEAVGGML